MGDGKTDNQDLFPEFDDQNPLEGMPPSSLNWLETLAVRQGATEGLTTPADWSVPEIDPNSVVLDEPGYTPYQPFGQDTGQYTPSDPSQQAYDPNAYYSQQGYDPSQQAYDPNAYYSQQGYDPSQQAYDPNAYYSQQGYDPSQQAYDPNAYYSQQGYDPSQQAYDPNAYYSQQGYDPAQQAYDPNTVYAPPPAPSAPSAPLSTMDIAASGELPADFDPIAFMEALAKRQGASEGFVTAGDMQVAEVDPTSVVIDEPGYTPSEVIKARHQPKPEQAAPPPPPPAAAPAPSAPLSTMDIAASGELPADFDPIAFMEALAKRQGASEGFVTAGDMQVAEVDPTSVVIDEPGYTPSEVIKARHQPKPEQAAPPPPPPAEPQDFLAGLSDEGSQISGIDFNFDLESALPTPPAQVKASADAGLDSLLGSFDDDVLGIDFEADLFAEAPPAVAGEPFDLGLLDQLGAGSTATPSNWLDDLGTELSQSAPEPVGFQFDSLEAEEEAIPATHSADQLMATIEGVSDAELAAKQAAGLLSGEEEFAWLQRQALERLQAKPQTEISDEDLPPAEAVEPPDWLRSVEVRDEDLSFLGDVDESSIFSDDISVPDLPTDLPDWLMPKASPVSELDLPDFTVESINMEPTADLVGEPLEASLETFISLENYDPSKDEWAIALDEEHERSIDDEPSWFRRAMEKAASESSGLPDEPLSPPQAMPTPSQQPNWLSEVQEDPFLEGMQDYPDDLPSWLAGAAGSSADPAPASEKPQAEADIDIGTWLRSEQVGPKRDTASYEMTGIELSPDKLKGIGRGTQRLAEPAPSVEERLPMAQQGDLPSWVRRPEVEAPRQTVVKPASEVAAATPTLPPARPAPAPVPQVRPVVPPPPRQRVVASAEPILAPSAPPPVPAQFEPFRAKLEQNPDDHATRLSLARELVKMGDIVHGLQHYQTLVENVAESDTVSEDLVALISQNPTQPVARRLLGDLYMRQGYLQEALDAYRGALDNL